MTPHTRRRGLSHWHIFAFFALDALMALALVLWLNVALNGEIEIPEVNEEDQEALALVLASVVPSEMDADPPEREEASPPEPLGAAARDAAGDLVPAMPEAAAAAPGAPTPTPVRARISAPVPKPSPTARPAPAAVPAGASLPRTLNVVLLGSDKRPDSRGWRTDTIIVVTIDPDAKRVGVISVPRDLWISLPRYANRVNTLDAAGGPALLKQVLQSQLGIPIHYYARVDFRGFQRAIDALGGITVDVECRLTETTPDPGAPGGRRVTLDIPAGAVSMNGETALAFARSRYSTSDFDRMRRQEAVLLAARRKMLSPELLPRLPELTATLSGMVQTDAPAKTVLALARLGTEIELKNVRGFLIDERVVRPWRTPGGAAVQVADPAKIRAGVANLWNAPPLTEAIKRPPAMRCQK